MSIDVERLKIDDKSGQRSAGPASIVISSVFCLIVGLLIGFFIRPGERVKPIQVKTATVRPAGDQGAKAFSAGGWVEVAAPEYPVIVSARIPQRLEKLLVRQGDMVSGSQPLANLYDEDIKTRLNLAEARAREQEEKMKLAKSVYDRNQGLEKGAISAEELDRNLAEYKAAKEAHAAATAEADLVRRELSYCTVRAPDMAGQLRVLNVFHSPGSWIGMENARIVSLYDPSNLQVRVDVAQTNIKFVRPGGDVEVRAEANPLKSYAGTVLRIEPLAELAKNTMTVRIRIKDPDEMLFPEMVAHVNFMAEKKAGGNYASQLVVPSEAVVSDGASRFVFTCEQNIARRRKIEVGQISGQVTLVASGLTSGQRVIVSGVDRLADGMKVQAD